MSKGDIMNDRYEIVRKLEKGTQAEVFLVEDTNDHNIE